MCFASKEGIHCRFSFLRKLTDPYVMTQCHNKSITCSPSKPKETFLTDEMYLNKNKVINKNESLFASIECSFIPWFSGISLTFLFIILEVSFKYNHIIFCAMTG